MNESEVIAHRDNSGHWSAHFAGRPWLSFGGDTPQMAAIRLLSSNPDGPQHIVERRMEAAERVVFVIV